MQCPNMASRIATMRMLLGYKLGYKLAKITDGAGLWHGSVNLCVSVCISAFFFTYFLFTSL